MIEAAKEKNKPGDEPTLKDVEGDDAPADPVEDLEEEKASHDEEAKGNQRLPVAPEQY